MRSGEWDPAKAASTPASHGVSFDSVASVDVSTASIDGMTPQDDAAITAAARVDPDNPPLFDDERLDVDGMPKSLILIDADVADRLKAEGVDWQARANRILRDALGL